MNQYERELAYVKNLFKKVYGSAELNYAKRVKREFEDKYIVLISPTDTNFLKVRAELETLEMEATKKLTSLKLL
jgi:hypothetical protein